MEGVIMGINIPSKTDYSSLFQGFNNSANGTGGLSNILSDYASIKNGSYGKLMKAYYAKDTDTKKTGSKTDKESKDKATEFKQVASAADSLNKAADKLIKKGTDSVFNDNDTDKIYKAVKDFADSYNSFIKKAKDSSDDGIARQADNLANQMTIYHSSLKAIGITINDNDSLTIDEDAFKKADMSKVKSMFNSNQSMAYQVSAKAAMIGTSANSAANNASGYNNSGSYAPSYSSGSILNDIV